MNDVGTLTLSDFLLARIAEDEVQANSDIDHFCMDEPRDRWIARYARRALAECEAKRRIVAAHIGGEHGCPTSDEDLWAANWRSPCDTLRLLALPYADHPDYRQEWAV